MEDGNYVLHDYVTKTCLKTFTSYTPVHQICLDMECLAMAKIVDILLGELGIKPYHILSIRNDGVCVQPGKHVNAVWKRFEE